MANFFSSQDIKTLQQARVYLKRRAKDAVACYQEHPARFENPIELARYLARYW